VLKTIAHRLKDNLRDYDTAGINIEGGGTMSNTARLGGDEFMVLVEFARDRQCLMTVAERLITVIAQPIPLGETHASVTASVGISVFPFDGTSCDDLVSRADEAMYQAKKSGKNKFYMAGSEPR
jgi:diguanylate cyclase (GGDEF)-like protein